MCLLYTVLCIYCFFIIIISQYNITINDNNKQTIASSQLEWIKELESERIKVKNHSKHIVI
jgi:hypothetical protein